MKQVASSFHPHIVFPLVLLYFFIIHQDAPGQNAQVDSLQETGRLFVISSIAVNGNHQTKAAIILRELPFHVNDTLSQKTFSSFLKSGKENIFNTRLFNFVTIDTIGQQGNPINIEVNIHVVERWYIWPIPLLEISDRNFNSWLATMDLTRLTYGIDLVVSNFRGRNETLRVPIHFGFNRQFGFDYTIPYINRKKTIGFGLGAEINQNHEVIVKSVNNKPVYYKDPDSYIRQDIYSFIEIRFRPTIHSYHSFRLAFNSYSFSDTLCNIPGYTYRDKAILNFITLYYQYKRDHRDIAYYPLHGSYFDFSLVQNGFGQSPVNEFYFKSTMRGYWQLSKRWFYAAGFSWKYTFTGTPPYFLQQGLGYGRDFVRGYEYFVIDGTHFALFKNNFKFALVPHNVLDIGFLKSQKFNPIPFAFFLNLFADLGYVYNSDSFQHRINDLQDILLAGVGIGIDFTTYYDIVTRVEFSLNRNGVPGIYLHFTAPI